MIKKLLSYLIIFASPALHAIEDCSHGVNFSNGSTYKHLSAKVICHDREKPSVKSSETNLVNGKKQGKTILYDAYLRTVSVEDKTGKIYRIENYNNGELHGEVKTYDPKTGKLIRTQEYRNKKEISSINATTKQITIHGYTLDPKSYNKSTLIKDNNDNIVSLRCMDSPSANKEINRYCGFINTPGPVIKITNSGGMTSQVHYCKGKLCGKRLQTYSNGNKASESFTTKEGKIVSRRYNEKGVLIYEHTRSKDGKDEQIIENFDSGRPKEITTLHNHRPSEIMTYYQNGQKRYHAIALEKEIGQATSYYDSGQKREEYQFKRYSNSLTSRGRLINTSREYYESGKIHRENTWKDNYIERTREFDNNGKLTKDEYYYSDGSRVNRKLN